MKLTFSRQGVKCVLFDLDGTLVSTGGAGARALERAFSELYGAESAMSQVNPAGKTDPAIIREIFAAALRRACSEEDMRAVQERYLALLPAECEKAGDYRVMEGIPELLEALSARGAVMGLGTGNLERGARIKLERSKLNRHLPFGGFGSDAEHRAELLEAGRRRAEDHAGAPIRPEEVLVVGDTERDILAARQAKFRVAAVATGGIPARVLGRCHPDYLFEDFTDKGKFLKIACGADAA